MQHMPLVKSPLSLSDWPQLSFAAVEPPAQTTLVRVDHDWWFCVRDGGIVHALMWSDVPAHGANHSIIGSGGMTFQFQTKHDLWDKGSAATLREQRAPRNNKLITPRDDGS